MESQGYFSAKRLPFNRRDGFVGDATGGCHPRLFTFNPGGIECRRIGIECRRDACATRIGIGRGHPACIPKGHMASCPCFTRRESFPILLILRIPAILVQTKTTLHATGAHGYPCVP